MAQEFAKSFYNSTRWRKCRKSYISARQSIDGGLCERCKQIIGYIVHHKEWITLSNINNPDITLNHNNLEYVCQECHNRIEAGERDFTFDDHGRMIPFE